MLRRIITYTLLGFILIPILREGASMFAIQKTVSKYGELFLAPILIFMGLFMLDFGMLMPMSASATTGGYLLPVIFAIATGLPVLLISWILAYSISELGKFYNQIKWFEKWFRKIVAILFIAVGLYYAWIYYL